MNIYCNQLKEKDIILKIIVEIIDLYNIILKKYKKILKNKYKKEMNFQNMKILKKIFPMKIIIKKNNIKDLYKMKQLLLNNKNNILLQQQKYQ